MSKQSIKQSEKTCALTGAPLSTNLSLIDTDRVLERYRGGTYDEPDNVRAVDPRAHMARHGILRERESSLETLKALMDDRRQLLKLEVKLGNQILAYDRGTDEGITETRNHLVRSHDETKRQRAEVDKMVSRLVKSYDDPIVPAALGVPSLGEITVAGLLAYVDLEKARTASSLWAYVGLDKPSYARYEKGKASGGNKTLRTILWNTANSMTKNRKCAYRAVYDATKERLAASQQMTKTRTTQGHLVDSRWCDTKPGHRHHAALRAVMKHVLADYWFVGRELRGLDTRPLYAEEKLGHGGIVRPEERGWVW